MLSGKSFIKIGNRIGPKTDPWGTPDNVGTGSDALPSKLLVECAQGAMG